jgi:cytochrome c biogenesis protein CcdA
MTTLLLGWLAGVLATLSPCVLPLVPIVLGSAMGQHRLAPLAVTAGLATAFAALGVGVALVGFGVGIDTDVIRPVAAVMMIGFGAVLMVGSLQMRFATAGAGLTMPLADLAGRFRPEGLSGHFARGALLGAVWAPCTGPVLGATLGLAAQAQTAGGAALVMVLFALGSATPLVLLAYGSRSLVARRRERLAALSARAKPLMGVALVHVGALVLTGLDKALEAAVTERMPDWWVALTTSV